MEKKRPRDERDIRQEAADARIAELEAMVKMLQEANKRRRTDSDAESEEEGELDSDAEDGAASQTSSQ